MNHTPKFSYEARGEDNREKRLRGGSTRNLRARVVISDHLFLRIPVLPIHYLARKRTRPNVVRVHTCEMILLIALIFE